MRTPLTGEARKTKLEELKREFPESAKKLDEWEAEDRDEKPRADAEIQVEMSELLKEGTPAY